MGTYILPSQMCWWIYNPGFKIGEKRSKSIHSQHKTTFVIHIVYFISSAKRIIV